VVHLGVRTTTGDTEGDILETRPADMGLAEIEAVLPKFRGALQQLPPMHSALKKDGKPLYEYARAGITLERELRAITIHRLELLGFDAPFLRLRVTCSKGTYIRVLGEDIGAVLGCGAHLRELRRTGVGDLCIDDSLTLEQLDAYEESQRASLLAPVDTLLASFPPVQLSPDATRRFLHGQRLALGKESISHPPSPGRVRVYEETSQRLLGTAMFEEYGVLRPERLIAAMD
jgi:tRNA pseudouridine55 synthase